MVIMGECRLRAARQAGLPELSCIVHEGTPDPDELLSLQLIENVLREDLAPVESARAYQKLMAARDWSARQLAAELAIAPSTVTEALALLELPAEVQDRVDNGSLPAHTAFEVTRLDDPGDQVAVAEIAVTQNLKRAEVGELV